MYLRVTPLCIRQALRKFFSVSPRRACPELAEGSCKGIVFWLRLCRCVPGVCQLLIANCYLLFAVCPSAINWEFRKTQNRRAEKIMSNAKHRLAFKQLDVFTSVPLEGNQLAVFTD